MGGTVATFHRETDLRANGERFTRQHRRLVGDTDLLQVHIGIKVRARLHSVSLEEGVARQSRALDVFPDVAPLFHVAHHEVRAARILEHLRGRRARFLVIVFPVDQRGEPVLRIRFHPFPHIKHGTAGGVHHHAAQLLQFVDVRDGDTERGQDDHIVRPDGGIVEAGVA